LLVSTEPLRRLTDRESREVWDRFDGEFDFKPSMYVFPAITEPVPSVTWSLDALHDDPSDRQLDHVVRVVHDGLAASTPPGTALLVLEWQHTSYRLRPDLPASDMFLPDALGSNFRRGWPRSPYPDGDYPIYLSEDFTFGTFGHPWEHSLCVFGTDLLNEVAADIHRVLLTVLRRDGQPAATR
jgi:hypothetical protein